LGFRVGLASWIGIAGMLENEVFFWLLIISGGVVTVVLTGIGLFAL
jgi:hypothetical protein